MQRIAVMQGGCGERTEREQRPRALIVLPYVLAFASALPSGVSEWLLRVTPAAAFAVEQTLPQYHQVNHLYAPAQGFYPIAPAAGLAVLCAYTLGVAGYLLRTRDV